MMTLLVFSTNDESRSNHIKPLTPPRHPMTAVPVCSKSFSILLSFISIVLLLSHTASAMNTVMLRYAAPEGLRCDGDALRRRVVLDPRLAALRDALWASTSSLSQSGSQSRSQSGSDSRSDLRSDSRSDPMDPDVRLSTVRANVMLHLASRATRRLTQSPNAAIDLQAASSDLQAASIEPEPDTEPDTQ
eukprot:Selendium_serpulae@DN10105_c0_g1_i1.p1